MANSASVPAATHERRTYQNPVVPGFYPDPSLCTDGEYYYLATSTFAYYPGIPIQRSADLGSWETIGHVITDPTLLNFDRCTVSQGIWAPTIRFHQGKFYVIFSICDESGQMVTFLSSAADPAGSWDGPVRLPVVGFDPDLFFDDDGSAWVSGCRDAIAGPTDAPGEIWIQQIDLDSLQMVDQEHVIWHGAVRHQWIEAPHIYHRDGKYWLLAAEGGTGRDHAVTIGVSNSLTGYYRAIQRNPVLTHRHIGPTDPVQNVGHGDLVNTPNGESFALTLAVRPIADRHTLGRETFLVPVHWDETGPTFAPGLGKIPDQVSVPVSSSASRGAEPAAPGQLNPLEWHTLRGPIAAEFDGLSITLAPNPVALSELKRPAAVFRRQTSHAFEFAAEAPHPGPASITAITALQSEERFVEVRLEHTLSGAVVTVWQQDGKQGSVVGQEVLGDQEKLLIASSPTEYRFGLSGPQGEHILHRVGHSFLSTEEAGGFVGVMLGVCHRGPADGPAATFQNVSYQGK